MYTKNVFCVLINPARNKRKIKKNKLKQKPNKENKEIKKRIKLKPATNLRENSQNKDPITKKTERSRIMEARRLLAFTAGVAGQPANAARRKKNICLCTAKNSTELLLGEARFDPSLHTSLNSRITTTPTLFVVHFFRKHGN